MSAFSYITATANLPLPPKLVVLVGFGSFCYLRGLVTGIPPMCILNK
jgi:hypothetical protein